MVNSKISWLNLTPHEVNLINEVVTVQDRNGKISLRLGVDIQEATFLNIPSGPKPLTVYDLGMPCEKVDDVPFFTPISSSSFNRVLDYSQIEQVDVVIVSQKCAGLINANMPLINAGTQNLPMDLISLDKFYIPYNIVYYERKPIGALGLQKVTNYLPLQYYASEIQNGRHVSLPGLFHVCASYSSCPEIQRRAFLNQDCGQMENSLKIANEYIRQWGYLTYPEL